MVRYYSCLRLAQAIKLVPSSGTSSNGNIQLLAEWNKKHKEGLLDPEIAHHPDVDRLFDVLADWNEYLENHVSEVLEPQP